MSTNFRNCLVFNSISYTYYNFKFKWKFRQRIMFFPLSYVFFYTHVHKVVFGFNITGDNEDATTHGQISEEQSIPSSQNHLPDQANRITLQSPGEFAEHITH